MTIIKKNNKWLVLRNNSVVSFHLTEEAARRAAGEASVRRGGKQKRNRHA